MQYYNNISRGYDELYGEEQLNKLNTIKANIENKDKFKILDIGCGTGLATKVFKGEYLGVEPAIKLAEHNRLKDFKVICKNFEEVEINEKFDLILCVSAIHHIKNLDNAIDKICNLSHNNTVIAITILKNIKNKDNIKEVIFKKLRLVKEVKEKKDDILILKIKG